MESILKIQGGWAVYFSYRMIFQLFPNRLHEAPLPPPLNYTGSRHVCSPLCLGLCQLLGSVECHHLWWCECLIPQFLDYLGRIREEECHWALGDRL